MRALILCAGLGTRIRRVVKNKPKCMIKVAGEPVLQRIVNHLYVHGITEIIVNLHYKPEKVMQHFGTRLMYFYEPRPLGRTETIKRLKDWLGEKFLVVNGDTLSDISITQMWLTSEVFDLGVKYMDGEVFAGYEIIMPGKRSLSSSFDGYWLDMGTPKGLDRARRFLKNG